jgi:hypothetical protein
MWKLFLGKKFSGLTVNPDPQWAGMWRIHAPDGWVSDMANLARAKECARRMAVISGQQTSHWQQR